MRARRSPPVIRPTSGEDGTTLAHLIQQAYKDVALRFGLTSQNCPKHPSNCTEAWIHSDLERGVAYYLLEQANTPIGCAALETTDSSVAYLMRLAVRPEFRRRGFGEMLVKHIINQAQRLSISSLSIGLIAEQDELVAWYRRLGFVLGAVKQFDHLPFTVRFMAYPLHPKDQERSD
jgi:ribosomal protein S18 acetylase RimI-like enzyme